MLSASAPNILARSAAKGEFNVFLFHAELLHFVPCSYNFHHKFCMDAHRERKCSSAERDGAAVIHGNANTFYNNFAPVFRAVNEAMRKVFPSLQNCSFL